MKMVIQRVLRAAVSVEGRECAAIGPGLVLLVAIERNDDLPALEAAAGKVIHLRIFPVRRGVDDRMDRSILDVGGELLVVSQFTLAGSILKGRRPSFDGAAPPEIAEPLYGVFVRALERSGLRVTTGVFRAMMEVSLVNDGPVTFVLDSGSRT